MTQGKDDDGFSLDDPGIIILGRARIHLLFNGGDQDIWLRLPLPGVVIFVHGVNSDGEWYEAAEQGLCEGLNQRLWRRDQDIAHHGPEAGQLSVVRYPRELSDDGYLNPKLDADHLIDDADSFSPVIRFRWGYKASGEELQQFGDGIYLNEQNYWGGGPFANGCTALPDLWGQGLCEQLFLWIEVQHMNPVDERQVYSCPPRPYCVLAAHRLARLIESLRRKQADLPITVVSHSQGTMVAMAAAFLGDAMAPAQDGCGMSGPCVADNYVLCNSPYSLLEDNATENWSAAQMRDRAGRHGRQTGAARTQTLAAFFDIVRRRAALAQSQTVARIDQRMTEPQHGFSAQEDRQRYGLEGTEKTTYGRVTLYCNPHDQVISSATVQGVGWRGLCGKQVYRGGLPVLDGEFAATGAAGVFCQRVFAQDYPVGVRGSYGYWRDHWRQPAPGSEDFWHPRSKPARYSVRKGLEAGKSLFGNVMTVGSAPLLILGSYLLDKRINALPDEGWEIPLTAPDLPEPFKPEAVRFGVASAGFDQGYDPAGAWRDKERVRDADDPFAGDRESAHGGSDAAQGTAADEASLRYEQHAQLRMQAKREGRYKNNEQVTAEDKPETASAEYREWHNRQIKANLAATVDAYATDHSTIMTNPMHAKKALAYDVAIGVCDLRDKDLRELRIAADWRLLKSLDKDDPHKVFREYFLYGSFKGQSAYDWANTAGSAGAMPATISDHRTNKPNRTRGHP